jgi:hypothetical protein
MRLACRFTVCALVACLLSGCFAAAPPRLQAVDVRLSEASQEALVLTYGVRAANVAESDLPLVEMRYAFRLDGRVVYRGRRALKQTIAKGLETRLELPVVIPFGEAGGRPSGEHELGFAGELYYIKPGQLAEALFDAGLVQPTTGASWTHLVDLGALTEQPILLE